MMRLLYLLALSVLCMGCVDPPAGVEATWGDARVLDLRAANMPHGTLSHVEAHATVTNHTADILAFYLTGHGGWGIFHAEPDDPGYFAFVYGADTIALASWAVEDHAAPLPLVIHPGDTARLVVATPSQPHPPPGSSWPYDPRMEDIEYLQRLAEESSLIYVPRSSMNSNRAVWYGDAEAAVWSRFVRDGQVQSSVLRFDRLDSGAVQVIRW